MVRTLGDDATAEAVSLLADARETLAELLEEGVDGWQAAEPLPALAEPTPGPAPATATRAAPEPAGTPEASAPATPEPGTAVARGGERASLEDVRADLGDCRRCPLHEGRTHIVFGDGDPDADLMFIGEGPGEQEDRQGLPFVGRAGELLTQMIEKGLEIPRSSVYICNIVKCRPPQNRTPLPTEVDACRPFLDGQIDAVRPKVIVALGKPAASLLLGRDVAITRVRGSWHSYRGIPLMPTLHPAYVLRQYTPENRRAVWQDLKQALAKSREA